MSLIFNVGDRVRVASTCLNGHQRYVGVTGVVKRTADDTTWVVPDPQFVGGGRTCDTGYWNFADRYFTLEHEFNDAEYEDDIT